MVKLGDEKAAARNLKVFAVIKWAIITMLVLLMVAIAMTVANADTEIFIGYGDATYEWCGDVGGWRQPPLPVDDHRDIYASEIGIRFRTSSNMAYDVSYVRFSTARVRGIYVKDDDYNHETGQIYRWDRIYQAVMETRTEGLTASMVPSHQIFVENVHAFGRFGGLYFHQETDWRYRGNPNITLTQAGERFTWLLGIGIEYRQPSYGVAIEYRMYKQVKWREAPVGGDQTAGVIPGLTSTTISIVKRF